MARDLAGIILAAGLGTRLRPISGGVPKPLVPFFSLPLLEFVFKKFTLAGISDVGLNTHFLPEKIEEYLKTFHHSDVFLSKETPDILGTGGAYYGFKPWVKNRTTVVCNGDVLTSADLGATIDTVMYYCNGHSPLTVLRLSSRTGTSTTREASGSSRACCRDHSGS